MNFTVVKYSLHKCSEIMLRQFIVYHIPEFTEAENFPPCSLDLSLVFPTLESFTAKMVSSKDPGHWLSEAYSVTLLGLISWDTKKRSLRSIARKTSHGN